MYLKKNLTLILLLSSFVKFIFIILFHERSLTDEWQILINNFEISKSFSFYVFNEKYIPTSYMPPLYFIFLYLSKIIVNDKFNFLYLIYFFQLAISGYSVIIFYKICKNFFDENYTLFGTLIFSLFPLIIFGCAIISSATIQLALYLTFIHIIFKIIEKNYKISNLFLISLVSALCLLLRGEFLIILLFSLTYLVILDKKFFLKATLFLFLTILIISPYLKRNYENTKKIHIVNSTGFNLWKGNNHFAKVDGFQYSLHPSNRKIWPKVEEFENLYSRLDQVKEDELYEINRDKVFKDEAFKNIISDKKKYLLLYIKKIISYFFIDTNSSLRNYYNPFHIIPAISFGILSLLGVGISLKKKNNRNKIFYLFSLMSVLTFLISIFFILPRYKFSIVYLQILFSIFGIQYIIKKIYKRDKF